MFVISAFILNDTSIFDYTLMNQENQQSKYCQMMSKKEDKVLIHVIQLKDAFITTHVTFVHFHILDVLKAVPYFKQLFRHNVHFKTTSITMKNEW